MAITCIILNTLSLIGQNQTQLVRGTVIDEDTRVPLFSAMVFIRNLEPLIDSTTDMDGDFRLDKVPIEKIELIIPSIKYKDEFLSSIEVHSTKVI